MYKAQFDQLKQDYIRSVNKEFSKEHRDMLKGKLTPKKTRPLHKLLKDTPHKNPYTKELKKELDSLYDTAIMVNKRTPRKKRRNKRNQTKRKRKVKTYI